MDIIDIIARLNGAIDGTHGLDEAEERVLLSDAAAEIERLRAALRLHHGWHLRQGDVHIPDGMGGDIVLDGAAEYADSAMGETTAELLGRAAP